MKTALKNLKADVLHVLVQGDSNTVEQARVFILLAVPVLSAIFMFGKFPV